RKHFDLYFKVSPLLTIDGVPDASPLRSEVLDGVDILVARENTGGLYQGSWDEHESNVGTVAGHRCTYSERQVSRFLYASARLAKERRGELTVIWKEAGLPSLSRLWRKCAEEVAGAMGVRLRLVDIDLMAYQLVCHPADFDVIAAPNLFGDVLADLGAVLLGSRGVSYSGNYTECGHAVYQTNHGAAYDLAGSDRANPAGQILSAALMLRASFGLESAAAAIEEALRQVWSEGWRTADVARPGCRLIGTQEMGRRVAGCAAEIACQSNSAIEFRSRVA
ncbi:MAG: isocitrate/isopropylmalate family dehydrogenase, partial [Gemmataceae bacterium]